MYSKARRKPTTLLSSTGLETSVLSGREEVVLARKALLNGGGGLSYFEDRGLARDTLAPAFVGYEPEVYFPGTNGRGYKGPGFLYPCIGGGRLLGIHYKSQARNDKGKRLQKWGRYADDLPRKGHGTALLHGCCTQG